MFESNLREKAFSWVLFTITLIHEFSANFPSSAFVAAARVLMNTLGNSELFTEAGGIPHELMICLCWYVLGNSWSTLCEV